MECARPKQYLPHLDGLRGVSVSIVVFYHLGFTLARNGWLCISVFFALSGLLVTGITVEAFERDGFVDVARFWARRVGRLFPALFATVLVVGGVSSHLQRDDDTALWYLRTDLLSAIFYVENINLAYWRKDDYFHAFQAPSPVRHIWTLSIEEQYYFAWPLLFLCASQSARKDTSETRSPQTSHRSLYLGLAMSMAGVIVATYVVSYLIIRDLGVSAAYYSTFSRAGDFACGAIVLLVVRLFPPLWRRYKHMPNLPPMSTGFRVLLEVLFLIDVLLLVCPPMLQLSLDFVLPFYFYVFRLPFGILVMGLSVAGAIQLSEPLPPWALVSRLMRSSAMTTLGMISYGVYLFHWPLILWLGDPIHHTKFEHDIDPGKKYRMNAAQQLSDYGSTELLRDWGLVALSLVLGYVSFFCFEKPLQTLAAQHRHPWRVLLVGFTAAAICAGLVILLTSGAVDPYLPDKPSAESLGGTAAADVSGRLDELDAKVDALRADVSEMTSVLRQVLGGVAVNASLRLPASPPAAGAKPSAPTLQNESNGVAARQTSRALKMVFVGDSVADALGKGIPPLYEQNLRCRESTATQSAVRLPRVTFSSLVKHGSPSRLYFLPCSHTGFCKGPARKDLHASFGPAVRGVFAERSPDIVVLKDWQWPVAPSAGATNSFEQGLEALANMLQEAHARRVRHLFTLTTGPWSKRQGTNISAGDLAGQRQVLRGLQARCRGGEQGMQVSILHWHLLVCPTWNEAHPYDCPWSAHGFDKILPDKTHPKNEAGNWLMAQVLAMVLVRFATLDTHWKGSFLSWDAAQTNIGVVRCLLAKYKTDNDPPLPELLETYEVCPPAGGWHVSDTLA